ncbi:hypothetical protein [Flavobacterium pectinovorum]|uniref:Cell division protein ZapA n=1 Tax=Flavobacterium pectinovorum TaxID=29533 RepID=A0AB36NV00_9FLAO|nr:hypothetical protein [Flavobacterium pectinovorum]OXA99960.1 hypothetical protein B0A72_20490 [Flavobacterium pectinovorum]SHM50112.1 hypothetical protein SAMN05444387_2654 [Flavobacterium pectinovorum]
MAALKKTKLTLEERAFETAKILLEKYQNPHNLKLEENSNLEDSYTILITLLYTEKLNEQEQLAIVSIIDEMKLLDGNR